MSGQQGRDDFLAEHILIIPVTVPAPRQETLGADRIRALAPVGTDRTVVTRRGTFSVTVVEYGDGAMIAGMHPDLYTIPFEDIREIR